MTPGARLGPYEIVALIGAGGMGEVYRARDTRLGRDVALKVLLGSFAADADRLRRFEHEARATAVLNHPNILAVFDVGTDGATPYLVSELLDGQTLRAHLADGALPMRRAIDWATQVARGLAAAHERGIVHRDLKPENVIITSDGRAKILDFGLAKLQTDAPSSMGTMMPTTPPPTNAGVVLGTVGYMSPEQARGAPADHRSDIFAFGAVLYEMMTGRRAFQRDTAAETMTAILREDPPAVSDGERVPQGLQRVIAHCLEKEPALRFKSADDLAFALETLSSTSGSAAPASGGVSPLPAAANARPRSRTVITAMAVAVISALIAASVTYWLRPAPAAPPTYQFNITPPGGWRLAEAGISFTPLQVSPDGQTIASSGINTKGKATLWLRRFDAMNARILSGTDGVSVYFWSPDSRAIAFVANDKLSKIDVASGAITPVADVPFVFSGAWGPTDQILLAVQGGFRSVRAAGGVLTPETTLADGESLHSTPRFLPDGQHYLFVVTLGSEVRAGAPRALDVGVLGSPTRVRLFEADRFALPVLAAGGHLLYVRQGRLQMQALDERRLALTGDPTPLLDGIAMFENRPYPLLSMAASGTLVYVPAQTSVRHQLAWYNRAGELLSRVGDEADYGGIDLSDDDSHIATSILEPGRRTRDIWLVDAASGVRTRFTFEPGDERTAIWWPDGRRVVFNAQRTGSERELYVRPANGSGDEQVLVQNGLSKDANDVSPDGQFLVFRESSRNGNDVFVLSLADGTRRAIGSTIADENYAQFSPDGRWLAFSSDESGQREIYVVPAAAGAGRWQVSNVGGTVPRWRRDGRELYYLAADGTLMATTVGESAEGFQIGATTPLFNLPLVRGAGVFYAVARDGQRFLANVDPETSQQTIVVNSDWRTLLPKAPVQD